MGLTTSKLEKSLGEDFPGEERYFGFENPNNICYCNSVLQSLYFCKPFRHGLLDYYHERQRKNPNEPIDDTLLGSLAELFNTINTQKKRTGSLPPRKFVAKLKRENELFNNTMHQDAHEFLNYLLNECAEILIKEWKAAHPSAANGADGKKVEPPKTFVHKIFQGLLTNEMKCLCCETVTSRDEPFIDLSLDVVPNASITACLKNFSTEERLARGDKFYCDRCCSLQEADKRLRVKQPPQTMVVHLKRFKYVEQLQRHRKLSYRVAFPFELRLPNASEDADQFLYELFAIVIHVGSGANSGHYISIIKSHSKWLIFDDDGVEVIEEGAIGSCFGLTQDTTQVTNTGYILFYQRQMPEGTKGSS